jgi:uncharacterized NAD(P)/FAD-binding protein YdhS
VNHDCDVAIVGGGFAGTMVAVNLVTRGGGAQRITVFDAANAFAKGAAYGPASDDCLLNVRAKAMGAFADDEEHFLRWLRTGRYGAADPDLGNRFVPRRLYGAYLGELFDRCRQGGQVEERARRVVDVERVPGGYVLTDGEGGRTHARVVTLAIGNVPPGRTGDAPLARAMETHAHPAWKFLESGEIDAWADVLLVGTGLTALDVMLQLDARGHRGRIAMLSRRGRFPLPHAAPAIVPDSVTPPQLEGTARDVVRALRRAVRETQKRGGTWQSAVDAVRAQTSAVWQRWPLADRRQFLRHVAPFWEIHRHRAPESTLRVRDDLIEAAQLRVYAGRLLALEPLGGRLVAQIAERRAERPLQLPFDTVIDCTGPLRDYRRSGDPLVEALFARGLARPDALGLGFAANADGALVGSDGRLAQGIFALGTPLRGTLYECGSVREVRVQAAVVARAIAEFGAAQAVATR